ncbi:MAG: alpha-amylase family glycosyl hydrolase [Anaerolineae bacterium]
MFQLPAWLQSVHHDGSDAFVSNPYPRLGETVQIRLRAGIDAPIRRVFVRTEPDGEQAITRMEPDGDTPPVRWWQAELPVNQPLLHYRFLLEAEDGLWWLNGAGPGHFDPLDGADFKLLADYDPPAWLRSAVFYQIFPDRFANGDPSNDPQPHEYEYRGYGPQTFPWGTLPPDDYPFPLVFFGGDLAGIVQHLDYVEHLGVNALYLNPIFTAPSNHKYDVTDYDHVDAHFGGDAALAALRQALDARGMRYLLDIVPNHCGYWHPWFQTARADAAAAEAGFFTFDEHPEQYAAWLGVWTLPKLNYTSAELRRRIYAGEDAVFRRWLRPPFSADGWRVDVANMLGRQGANQLGVEVARGIRQAVKQTAARRLSAGREFLRRHRPTARGSVRRRDELWRLQQAAAPLAARLQPGRLGHERAHHLCAPLPHRGVGRRLAKPAGSHSLGRGLAAVQPAGQPRHRAHSDPGRATTRRCTGWPRPCC